eukprot:TRINITY_DN23826_c0_g1_i1.p1 TRINITY_DN23826_c0_g1~~TRINITY_DN23826_c0_g1_i1.p1  ORF type:complete len:281 (+),score=51.18 TRINITY_DN23826_c0_g1_i1:78-920(+)
MAPRRGVKKTIMKTVPVKATAKRSAGASTATKKQRLPASLPCGLSACKKALRKLGWARGPVVGVDEAGRGPWAGPVVAAALALAPGPASAKLARSLAGVTDSKKLTEQQRELVFDQLVNCPEVSWSVSVVSRACIDRSNILSAAHQAMASAVLDLQAKRRSATRHGGRRLGKPGAVLVDGNLVPKGLANLPCHAVVGGDRTCFEIAGASVLAKVTRDRLMARLDRRFPEYGFSLHKGYGTAAHQAALARHGPCPEHRRTFEPLKGFLETGRWKRRGAGKR